MVASSGVLRKRKGKPVYGTSSAGISNISLEHEKRLARIDSNMMRWDAAINGQQHLVLLLFPRHLLPIMVSIFN